MNNIPKVRLQYAWLLERAASEYIKNGMGIDKPLNPPEVTKMRIRDYELAWKPYAEKVLIAIQSITGLNYRQNYIDVYIAPFFGAFSDPMVLGTLNEPDVFIDVLTHELIHRVLDDNTLTDFMTFPDWEELFGKGHSEGVLAHIQVHAIHEAVYLDFLKEPGRFERDRERARTNDGAQDYADAWDYVDTHGYKEIIQQVKEAYKDLAAQQ